MTPLKKMAFYKQLVLVASLLFIVSIHAQPRVVSPYAHNFDVTAANDTLNSVSTSSFLNTSSIKALQNAVNNLTKLENLAKKCVDADTVELDKINKQLSEAFPAQEKPKTLTPIQKYLDLKKKQLTDELSGCRLFLLRADEMLGKMNEKIRSEVKTQMFYAVPNIMDNLEKLPADVHNTYQTLNASILYQRSGLNFFNTFQGILLAILLVAATLIGLTLRKILGSKIGEQSENQFPAHLKQVTLCILKKYLPLLLPTIVFSLFITIISAPSLEELPTLARLSYALLILQVFIMAARFYFYPPKPAISFTSLPMFLTKTIVRRLKIFAWLVFLGYLTFLIFKGQVISESVASVVKTIFVTLISISLITIVWLVKSCPKFLYQFTFLRYLISFSLCTLLAIIIIAQWLGYHLFAGYFLYAISLTVFAIFIARVLNKLVKFSAEGLNGAQHNWQIRFKRYFGVKSTQRLREVLWLQLILMVVIWGGLFLILLKIWGIAQTGFHLVINAVTQGFQIGQFKIIPFNIGLGLIFFIFLSAVTRILCTHIAKNPNTALDKGNRESLASIIGYIGFSIALIIGLLIAGVNFSGLAIIAGALSVGIGFGLQNIVNNFISGIILLVERPIKPGDRIIVGDTEGYVRRISIRSTHIITLNSTDVIVPNSDLIQKQVTNYMLYDTNFKITLMVGVAYGSDTILVKKLLLDIAKSHPDVILDRPDHEPMVYFNKFSDSSLDFSLRCLIKDVDQKGTVQSDLYFMIDKVFRENGIEIAFPQRDLTIKNWPKALQEK